MAVFFDKTLDEPVVGTITGGTAINTALAQVEVAVVAGGAVVVRLGNVLPGGQPASRSEKK